jgi:dihydrofolate reductase/thymidylate synthase
MPLNMICCATRHKNKLAIGSKGQLLFSLKDDMSFFKNITSKETSNIKNIVLMGRKTYDSIPTEFKPLKNRINLVLTNNTDLIVDEVIDFAKDLYYITMDTFLNFYKFEYNVFVIGGSEIYSQFENEYDMIYLTEVKTYKMEEEPDTFINPPNDEYEIVDYSEKYTNANKTCEYRIIKYIHLEYNVSNDYKYFLLFDTILSKGNSRIDRTNVGTISYFGNSLRFDISDGNIPIMTTKYVPFKTIVEELLWICRGDTDAKILQKKNIKIWDGNTSRDFLDKRGLYHYSEGTLGAGYGWQLRFQGAEYDEKYSDTSKIKQHPGGIDQLEHVLNLLKNDPFSRRIMFSYWNPSDFDKTALIPCHVLVQFYVEEIDNVQYLSCQFYMRSSDTFLASCYNICSYTILTYILAKKCGMKPKDIIYTVGDSHIYNTHIDAVKEQMERKPRCCPKLLVDDSVIGKDWGEIDANDFELIGYFPDKSIRVPMAV